MPSNPHRRAALFVRNRRTAAGPQAGSHRPLLPVVGTLDRHVNARVSRSPYSCDEPVIYLPNRQSRMDGLLASYQPRCSPISAVQRAEEELFPPWVGAIAEVNRSSRALSVARATDTGIPKAARRRCYMAETFDCTLDSCCSLSENLRFNMAMLATSTARAVTRPTSRFSVIPSKTYPMVEARAANSA